MRERMVTPLTFLSRVPALLVALVLLGLMATTSGAAEEDTNRMSVEGSGKEANWDSSNPSISADGRFVAFDSLASNLVPGDVIEADRDYYDNYDVFVRDLRAGTTERLSVDRIGSRGENWIGYNPSISSDGSVVAFESIFDEYPWGPYLYYSVTVVDRQTEIRERWTVGEETGDPSISSDGRFVAVETSVPSGEPHENVIGVAVRDRQTGTTVWKVSYGRDPAISADGHFVAFRDSAYDVFVRDLQAGTTEQVSIDSSENPADKDSYSPSISSDGRFVAFVSSASNLVANDTNNAMDVFVRDRQMGTTERVSIDRFGTQANGGSDLSSISSDGRHVAFRSSASDLVRNDSNDHPDVFVRNLRTDTTQRVSVDSSENPANKDSGSPSISSDGRFVAFESSASNLVANDTNRFQDIFVRDRQAGTTRLVSVGDSTAPRVARVVPTEGETGIALKANVVATFSEKMDKSTLTKDNFRLYKLIKNPDGTTTAKQITNVTVRRSADGLSATLNPFGSSDGVLATNARYKAVVSTGALDVFGHRLDQKLRVAGNQPKVWFFKTRG